MSLSIPPDALARLNMFQVMSDRSSQAARGESEGERCAEIAAQQDFRPETGDDD